MNGLLRNGKLFRSFKNTVKILFCGSFKFLDEMKKLGERLNSASFDCLFPKFALGDFRSKKIEKLKESRKKDGLKDGEFEKIVKVTKWFMDQVKECDAMIVFDKNGYIGLSAAAEIGAAYILGKPVFFLEKPKDHGIRAFLQFAEKFEVLNPEQLVGKLKKVK